jgi:hypothetical protein
MERAVDENSSVWDRERWQSSRDEFRKGDLLNGGVCFRSFVLSRLWLQFVVSESDEPPPLPILLDLGRMERFWVQFQSRNVRWQHCHVNRDEQRRRMRVVRFIRAIRKSRTGLNDHSNPWQAFFHFGDLGKRQMKDELWDETIESKAFWGRKGGREDWSGVNAGISSLLSIHGISFSFTYSRISELISPICTYCHPHEC